ncbi:hypothetical protein [Streptomyces sp. NBC_00162]|uniref:hypothetical protein n=1 Tax=Streptomyces sp. NBC_00162 TaxID=2903629 RepID=UPI00214B71EF|nr:hypothetical protein [Streptomyces sp. NBC_00162]UUU39432.1 hypothetical protein JIW86_11875 [Streptomyces sp. NBC_00162]
MTVSALLTAEGEEGKALEDAVSNSRSTLPQPSAGGTPTVSAVSWSVVPDPAA